MPVQLDSAERKHLERAIELARQGWGRVHKNPMVGCVLVRAGEVVGEGWHAAFGGPHAERVALENAGSRARGATAFVSLEPCSHQGKTGPCTEALVRAGVVRVVYAVADPGAGAGGHARLQALGVQTHGPIQSEVEGRASNQAYFRRVRGERPYTLLKLATSLDGRVSAGVGRTTRITGPEADREVQRLRAGFDAVMVGVGTVLVDDPRLSARPADFEPFAQPLRIVLDGDLRTPADARLFDPSVKGGAVHLFCGPEASADRVAALEARGARIHRVARSGGHLSLPQVFERLQSLDVGSLFCEGGPQLATSLMQAEIVDRLLLFMGPVILGEQGIPAFERPFDLGGWKAPVAPHTFGVDVCISLDSSH